jgi:uncharacterized protein YcbK (DUF882 family)
VKKRYPNKTHYSPHFSREELECKCGCKPDRWTQRRLRVLAVQLERLRKELGGTLGILSGHRCRAYNARVGGAVNSQHIYGRAADLSVPRGQQDRYVRAAERVPRFRRGGIGVYPNGGVHVDTRNFVARWNSWGR